MRRQLVELLATVLADARVRVQRRDHFKRVDRDQHRTDIRLSAADPNDSSDLAIARANVAQQRKRAESEQNELQGE